MLDKNTFIKFMPTIATVRETRDIHNSTARLTVNKNYSHVSYCNQKSNLQTQHILTVTARSDLCPIFV